MPYLSTLINKEVEQQLRMEYEKQKIAGINSPAEVVIHNDTAEVYKRLAERGIIMLYYTPTPQKDMFAVGKNIDSAIQFSKKHIKYTANYQNITNRLRKKFNEIKKYKIPVEKIDDVFKMINKGNSPNEIVDILS